MRRGRQERAFCARPMGNDARAVEGIGDSAISARRLAICTRTGLMRFAACTAALIFLAGCIDHPEAPTVPDGSPLVPPASSGQQSGSGNGTGTPQGSKTDPPATAKAVLSEEVYLLMKDGDGGEWLCTATLISKDRAITAAHCLTQQFVSFELVAPGANGKRVTASNPTVWQEGDYENDPSVPDIGFLTLDESIDLPAYAVLTDVTARVEKGEELTASAVVRTKEEAEAPLHEVDNLHLQSTAQSGYEHGFGTQLFSHGGDSGAGLFLMENGVPTHKLIGVARQPEPDKNLDHFTRIDADFLQFLKDNGGT